MRVLLVEDDALLGKTMRAGLEQQGHIVDWLTESMSAELAVMTNDYAVLVLNIGLSGQTGATLLQKLRAKGSSPPVLMVAARDDMSRIASLDDILDDFIVKPFDVQELSARLHALVRRTASRVTSSDMQGRLQVDSAARVAILDNRSIALTAREFAILAHLLEQRGKVLSKQQLQEALYTYSDEIESNTVEVHVHHLRRKLGRDLIKTMHGMGYMIDERIQA
ncbi:MAG: winged helix-turn-helix domain-containing protein [Steroidobacteraceae bacterium]